MHCSADCHSAQCRSVQCQSAQCHSAQPHSAECHFAECLGAPRVNTTSHFHLHLSLIGVKALLMIEFNQVQEKAMKSICFAQKKWKATMYNKQILF